MQQRQTESGREKTHQKNECTAMYKNENHFVWIKKFQSICDKIYIVCVRRRERMRNTWRKWMECVGWSETHWILTIVKHPFEHDLGF